MGRHGQATEWWATAGTREKCTQEESLEVQLLQNAVFVAVACVSAAMADILTLTAFL